PSCTAPPIRRATRAISCSRPRARSSTCCAFRSAACPRPRPARSPAVTPYRLPPSPTARTSASCRAATTPRWSPSCAPPPPRAAAPAPIVALDGRVLGRHDGVAHFTVGQRRGLGVAGGTPLYVVRLEPGDARVVVGPHAALARDRVVLRDVNWLAGAPAGA